jgi:hypothetical protein
MLGDAGLIGISADGTGLVGLMLSSANIAAKARFGREKYKLSSSVLESAVPTTGVKSKYPKVADNNCHRHHKRHHTTA